jgi:hypothetical protein
MGSALLGGDLGNNMSKHARVHAVSIGSFLGAGIAFAFCSLQLPRSLCGCEPGGILPAARDPSPFSGIHL